VYPLLCQLRSKDLSCAIYTQITDVEVECDGFLNYDRSAKLDANQIAEIADLNQRLVAGNGAMSA
jgi:hypothetical protein